MDSTKKMTKKLAGDAAGTASWVTNVGNEHGQVLMSVLTESEGDGLLPMADGLMRRYSAAGKAPPRVLYVDRDCGRGGSKPLPPARALLEEPLRPERPLKLSEAEDASGQAVTRRGPLAPALFNILAITAQASVAHASTSADNPVASTSAFHTVASSSASQAIASTSAAHAVASSSAAQAVASTSAAVPKMTAWQRKVREEQDRRRQAMGLPTKIRRKT